MFKKNTQILSNLFLIGRIPSFLIFNFSLSIILILLTVSLSYSQTCRTDIEKSTPDSRFTDNGNQTISDKKTGLMWKKCSEGLSGNDCSSRSVSSYAWQNALKRAETVRSEGFAGYNDWRLPNIKELSSIVEEACISPAINLTFFPNTYSSSYWSSSPYSGNGNGAWVLGFGYGGVGNDSKSDTDYVRLVRLGQ